MKAVANMSRPANANVPNALRKDWRRWTEFVRLVARRRSDLARVDPKEYHALHTRITAACRERAGSGDETGRKFYEDLEAEVRPWLSPGVLAHADCEILTHLLARCENIERELGGRSWVRAIQKSAAPTFYLGTAAALAVVTWRVAHRGVWSPLAEAFQDVSNAIKLVLWRSSDLEKWSALVVVVILLSIYNVSCTTRS
jgi:hypothetical protein